MTFCIVCLDGMIGVPGWMRIVEKIENQGLFIDSQKIRSISDQSKTWWG